MNLIDLDRLRQALESCATALAQARQGAVDPGLRQQFQTLAADIQQGQTQFLQGYQQELDGIQKRVAQVQQAAQQSIENAKALQASLEVPPPPTPPPTASPPPPSLETPPTPEIEDPNLGPRLRRELLEHFSGLRRATFVPHGQELDREIWLDWDETDKPRSEPEI